MTGTLHCHPAGCSCTELTPVLEEILALKVLGSDYLGVRDPSSGGLPPHAIWVYLIFFCNWVRNWLIVWLSLTITGFLDAHPSKKRNNVT